MYKTNKFSERLRYSVGGTYLSYTGHAKYLGV
jgi:hypothetical protein